MCIGKAAKPNLGKTQENREKKKKMGGGGVICIGKLI